MKALMLVAGIWLLAAIALLPLLMEVLKDLKSSRELQRQSRLVLLSGSIYVIAKEVPIFVAEIVPSWLFSAG